jgi:hypothetical protein
MRDELPQVVPVRAGSRARCAGFTPASAGHRGAADRRRAAADDRDGHRPARRPSSGAFVAQLADRGVAALAIELGSSFEQLPSASVTFLEGGASIAGRGFQTDISDAAACLPDRRNPHLT